MVAASTADATPVAINGGTGFPHNTNQTDMYEFTIECRSDGTVRWCVWTARNITTDVAVSGVLTSGLPTEGTAVVAFVTRATGTGAGSAVPVTEFGGMFCGALA
jgi:hypothetical protein